MKIMTGATFLETQRRDNPLQDKYSEYKCTQLFLCEQ